MAKRGGGAQSRSGWREARTAVLTAVAPALMYVAFSLLLSTLRIEVEGLDEIRERWRRGERVVLTFWHGRQLAMAMAVRTLEARPCILVSRHRDGEIATRLLRYLGVATARGSTTRGAVTGFRGLLRAYSDGYDLAVVPDGPRGPCYQAKRGVAHLSKATGAIIVPASAAGNRVWRLRSWDRMIIPKPFSRVLVLAGEPVSIDPEADAEAIEEKRVYLEAVLNELTEAAEKRMQAAPS